MGEFPFRVSLNASTLFPYELDIRAQIRTAAEAGYEGIEIWMKDLQAYAQGGGSVAALRREAADLGIEIAGAISFIPWADTDEDVRARGRRQTDEELTLLAELGCPSFAAPPFGDVADATAEELAARYAALAEQARGYGIVPILEFWGRARRLSRLGEAIEVARLSGVEQVPLLLDPFHLYTGGSDLNDLSRLRKEDIGIVHANDYPSSPPRETITDADRLFPGDGIAPSAQLAAALAACGYRGFLSLELFAPDYGGRTALETARHGLAKIKQAYAV
ncbi:sugar phosphate isomerase/epimerase family protein [Cohnella nanjingensis]|uniref:Sugar phosphate isomerase/epimerase n=1 Tax=Cohnella nanjingensis TaxID=1387779 RepID=A0A7X0VH44_9BACL|nr:sugar phosphate isomerase/epimerase family protein [Cohnella nanjingensis]MBB6673750.1 sugar phosphate isomerase/epimerase [Cohnella nanjingensis]